MSTAPTIKGARVRLRPHRLEDMEVFWSFYQSSRAQMVDAPENRRDFWYKFASEVGAWDLMGMGGWAMELDDVFIGQIAVIHPPHFAEPELGWIVFDGFEGQGFAFEGAQLALGYVRETIKPASLVSYIDARNRRSLALAQRLGGVLDDNAPKHDAEDVVYRYEVAA